ncbi:MAG: PAS domain-containing protein [Lachnospiraceae bacterium]|nr:PAS domain-containing protein [Lachnospiraceae bacterium]
MLDRNRGDFSMDGQITQEAKKRLDQLFESYSIIAEDTFVFLCDMQYDYSRWSKALVENFDLPSEYMYRAGEIWEEHIHPEDRKAYREGLDAIFRGGRQDTICSIVQGGRTAHMICAPAAGS